MKRAAVIKIYRLLQDDPPYWHTDSDSSISLFDGTAELLLADLRTLVKLPGPSQMGWVEAQQAAARVRALLTEEAQDE